MLFTLKTLLSDSGVTLTPKNITHVWVATLDDAGPILVVYSPLVYNQLRM